MSASDAELVGRFRDGDDVAFAQLVARWQSRAYALAYRLTLDPDESEDIRQAAFVRAHRSLPTFAERSSFSTWLYKVVLNLCRDRRRAKLARERAMRRLGEAQGADQGAPVPASSATEQADTGRRVAEAVASLPDDVREVVIMRHYEGLKFAEIAEVLDAPVTTVKSRMTRGLKLLREQLEDIAP